jgi:predicted transcriptional regulator of viral defense system/very-short-patch-repair endonuclease
MANKERTEQLDRRGLAVTATRQHGVVSIRQLESAGFGRSTVTDEVAAGRLHRVHRGVYAVGHMRLGWHGYCLAAVLANAPGAVASHFSAGWLWGLRRNRPSGKFHLTAPTRRHSKQQFVLHHAVLADEDRDLVEGIPVTSLARTQLDLAAEVSLERVLKMLGRSEDAELLDLRALESVLERCGNHPGRGTLRSALDVYEPDLAITRSELERRFRELCRQAGLPSPAMNFVVEGYELDAYWPDRRFAVELDVYETHGNRASFEADRVRQEELLLVGIETIRVTGPRLAREPATVIEAVRTLLERRRPRAG